MLSNAAAAIRKESRSLLGYGGLVVLTVLIYLGIRAVGDTLIAPTLPDGPATNRFSQIHVNDFLHVLLALALVIASARALGALFRFLQQPPVIGEMIAGILLGLRFSDDWRPGLPPISCRNLSRRC